MGAVKVLVVEDDPAVRASLERSLGFEGYSVVTAADGEAALRAVDEHRPDAVLPNPFALEELLARLRALLRRASVTEAGGEVLAVGDLRLDTATREFTRAGRPITLTRTEHELLELFLRHPRRVLERPRILADVW